jgi:RsiW-degrading membrane proteinase PrsW (M82 family)
MQATWQERPMTKQDDMWSLTIETTGGHGWWKVLTTGLLLFLVGIVVLTVSGNPNIFPTVVMLGTFLVPATYVTFLYERRRLTDLSPSATFLSFVYGGVVGVLAAAFLEPLFVRHLDLFTAFQIGLVEEFVKISGVLVIARHHRHDSEMDGLVLGAAAGMGFAALESTGYAFTAFLRSGGSVSAAVAVTIARGIISPLGHGTWTAILAAVLFRESQAGRFRLNTKVLYAFFTVIVLHGLWDGLPGVLAAFVSSGYDIFIAQVAIGLIGLAILWQRWVEARHLQEERLAARADRRL